MSPQQRSIFDDVLRTRGNAQGPFLAWLLNPRIAQPAQVLGATCRFHTSLLLQESELLILIVAAHYDCTGELQIHEPIARRAGIGEDLVAGIRSGARLELATSRLSVLAELARELLQTRRVSVLLFEKARQEFGEQCLVEIVATIGYYAFVAYTLNAFEMRPQ